MAPTEPLEAVVMLPRNAMGLLRPARPSLNPEQISPVSRTSLYGTLDAGRVSEGQRLGSPKEERGMDLGIWLPAMFLLGLVAMGLCYAFLIGCENI
jgi:hypothetical protein